LSNGSIRIGLVIFVGRHGGDDRGWNCEIAAATAQQRGLTILSHNLRHLAPLGVAVIDPFVKLPPT
jgi:hypothetical protein